MLCSGKRYQSRALGVETPEEAIMETGPACVASEASRQRRAAVGFVDLGPANANQQNGEGIEISTRESLAGPVRPIVPAAGRMERRNSAQQACYQRYMPMDVLKMPIPRKTKEKRALFQHVSTESREFEDMKTILTSSYLDANSSSCFTYSKPRLIDSEQLEKEFVEKRKEMKSDGRTEKELEENYCFLLPTSTKLPLLCEKGLMVGHSRITILGNPTKGVYLSRYSDLIQTEPLMPGATGEIIIFKVLKGKVKSIYENMKNLLDPTPRFDSHISKNSSKVTSLNSYHAFELTQQYFYEYMFDELRQRPRQVCPYAVVSFQFKGKDSILPSTPLPSIRLNSQSGEGDKGCRQFTVWTGDLVKGGKVLFQVSLQSLSPPLLPHRLPEKLEIEWVMRLDHVTDLLPATLFSYKLYNSSKEVVNSGYYCSLLEVTDKSRSTTSVTKLLQELEVKGVVLVFPLSDRGFLFLLSSVQMAPSTERSDDWKRCLQALFVFPKSRDVAKCGANCSTAATQPLMPQLSQFIPALHHSLLKVRANPPPELSAGVERQAREYLIGLKEGKVRHYSMGDYDSKINEQGKFSHQRANLEGYLRAYLYGPAFYLLSLARAKQMVEMHCGPEESQAGRRSNAFGGQREATHGIRDRQANSQEVQQLIDLVLTCKRNADNEVNREEAGRGTVLVPLGRKRRLEQVKAERAIKYLRASQDCGKNSHIPGNQVPAPPGSLTSLLYSLGLKDLNLREDGSEPVTRLHRLLTGLMHTARGAASQSSGQMQTEMQKEPSPFEGLAAKMGLPTNCDIDLRKQEDLEEQTAGSISSLEGFSPGSHGGDWNQHGGGAGRAGAGGWSGRREGGCGEEEEEWPVSWVLIPITGLPSERYSSRDMQCIPQDPRFQHLADATEGITTETRPPRTSPAPSPEPNSPPSPSLCPSPCPSPYSSPSQCPSPEPSLPPSPSQCPSPEPSSPPSPPLCPSPPPRTHTPPSQHPTSTCRFQTVEPIKSALVRSDSGANEEHLNPTGPREFEGASKASDEKSYRSKQLQGPISSALPAPERASVSPSTTERTKEVVKATQASQEEHPTLASGDEEQVSKKCPGGSLGSMTSSTFSSSAHIDTIVDRHQGNLSSEIQLILQRESVHLSLPQSPHSTSRADGQGPHPPPPPRKLISQFSQYVSFYNTRPPLHEYVSSLQEGIDSLLMELHDGWLSRAEPPDADNALASKVDAFVSSIREGREGDAAHAHDPEPWGPNPPADGSSPSHAVLSAPASLPTSTCQQSAELDPRDGFNGVDTTLYEPTQRSDGSPPATMLSSLISQIQPEVFSKLVEIVQDVKRNSVHFYVHATEPGDSVYEEIKEHLLKQGNVDQSPVAFLRQENAESRLLVIIKNKDIAAHIHKIPGLVSLKRHTNVVFVGIDTLDDIMNNSYNELFVSGGCIISHDFILDPDFITRDRLTALLVLLEKLSSPGSVWKMKVHCKTHKRLKEQSRFRQEAAVLLDILSLYQKRQIVEFLPYHYCDMTNQQSPDLKCVMTLQAQCTEYRHMIVLTDPKFQEFPDYASEGIVMASVNEVLHDLAYMVGYHDNRNKQTVADHSLPKDRIHSHLSHEHHQHIPQQLGPGHSPLSHLPEQLVPDTSCADGPLHHSDKDLEDLRLAISHFRAERLAQKQQQQQQQQKQQQQQHWMPPPGSQHPEHGGPAESVQLNPEKKAVAAKLELIHSALQLEVEVDGRQDRARHGAEPGDQRSHSVGAAAGDPSAPGTVQNTVAEPSQSAESTADRREETDHPVEGDRARTAQLIQEQPRKEERAPLASSTVSTGSTLPGNTARPRDQGPRAHPAPSRPPLFKHSQQQATERHLQQSHLQQSHLQQSHLQQSHLQQSHLQLAAHRLQPHQLPHLRGQAFPPGSVFTPLNALRGGSLLGARPVWSGGLTPASATALVWGFHPAGVSLAAPGLLAGYNNPAGQGGARHPGGQRGGSFSGM